jgi:hypothetical protein
MYLLGTKYLFRNPDIAYWHRMFGVLVSKAYRLDSRDERSKTSMEATEDSESWSTAVTIGVIRVKHMKHGLNIRCVLQLGVHEGPQQGSKNLD